MTILPGSQAVRAHPGHFRAPGDAMALAGVVIGAYPQPWIPAQPREAAAGRAVGRPVPKNEKPGTSLEVPGSGQLRYLMLL